MAKPSRARSDCPTLGAPGNRQRGAASSCGFLPQRCAPVRPTGAASTGGTTEKAFMPTGLARWLKAWRRSCAARPCWARPSRRFRTARRAGGPWRARPTLPGADGADGQSLARREATLSVAPFSVADACADPGPVGGVGTNQGQGQDLTWQAGRQRVPWGEALHDAGQPRRPSTERWDAVPAGAGLVAWSRQPAAPRPGASGKLAEILVDNLLRTWEEWEPSARGND